MLFSRIIILILLVIAPNLIGHQKGADLIIFSFDRPLQFYALMESIEKYITGIKNISVLYRVSSQEFNEAYDRCFERFKNFKINAVKQGESPHEDFKPLLLLLLKQLKQDYMLFAVDDIIVKDYIDLGECIAYLEAHNAYGFYLRLGKNISHSYTARTQSPLPIHMQCAKDVMSWKLSDGVSEWRYLNTVDMTLYRKDQLFNVFLQLPFHSPDTLEIVWAAYGDSSHDLHKTALCYDDSKIINIPLNLVQRDWQTQTAYNMKYDLSELLQLFNQGYRMHIESYFKFNNSTPHIEIIPFLRKSIV